MKERFGKNNECMVVDLNVSGFDQLDFNKKALIYHLSMAGHCGNKIYLNQRNTINEAMLIILNIIHQGFSLGEIKDDNLRDGFADFHDGFLNYYKEFLFHNGIFHSYNNKPLQCNFSKEEFLNYFNYSVDILGLEIYKKLSVVIDYLFETALNKIQTSHESNIDNLKLSSLGFYSEGISQLEIEKYFKDNYGVVENAPLNGINSYFEKDERGEIIENKISMNDKGLNGSGELLCKMVYHLNKAMVFAENEKQAKSIQTLIDFYKSGDPVDFDRHSIAWLDDKDSDVFFINGFIETYLDPLGRVGSFESLVAFKNPEKTKIVNKIIDNIQWFEDNLPIDERFKKKEAVGLSASSITVVSAAGEASPVLPLGICLPNSDWIRAKFGSKSVNLDNVSQARDSNQSELRKEFFLDKYTSILEKYQAESNSLHTDLHEITGHGSGQSLSGVSNADLGNTYSIIEECRADLVALYYIADESLVKFGIISEDTVLDDFALAQYVYYITNGLTLQLKRVDLGSNLTQTHMRNRQIISKWLLDNNYGLNLVVNNNKNYIEVNDVNKLRQGLALLLAEIQRIKSEGDKVAAERLIEKYGTEVDLNHHKETIERYKLLNTPSYIGFNIPEIKPAKDGKVMNDFIFENGVDDYILVYPSDFIRGRFNAIQNGGGVNE